MSRALKLYTLAGAAAMVLAVTGAAVVPQLIPDLPRIALHKTRVTAQFSDAVGLYIGNGVSVLGMDVGKVTGITPRGGYVEVELAIDAGVDIPADAQAVTVSSSVLTDRHVELTPAYTGGPKLRNGDVLSTDRTRTPVEFERTLAMMHKLGSALRGDDKNSGPLGEFVALGSQITVGNGPDIKATLGRLSQALQVGSDKGEHSKKTIQTIITGVSELSEAASRNDAALREFGSYVHQLSGILAAENLGSGKTGAKINRLLAETSRLLEGNQDRLRDAFSDVRTVATTLTDNERDLREILDVGPLFVDNFYNIIDDHAGSLRSHLLLGKTLFNSQFGKEICNLMGLKQLACATGTLADYGPDFGLGSMLDLMQDGIGDQP
ncbi:MCE family protein [Mycolicibacter sp. MYC123]|uniref:MCE family protein n=2 Tax=Mycolicibacter TaxID=1073531 RepID=A0ABU5YIV0_9MYCO|nr:MULTISPECIES: MCE family protein [unclassified Mycolicibacter]MEB3048929.1 MCE family protein [Mycolicibacter sp. MYC123]MEB3062147.1 MCE family protein [Mycolicibacter sp. MYC101]MEB3070358.1 MCE family protein [Mycolicibacter sp. MYC017]